MEKALSPFKLGRLVLPNRFIKAPIFENLGAVEKVSDELIDYHSDYILNGVGMTTTGFVSVSPHGREFHNHVCFREGIGSELENFASKIHQNGGKLSVQRITKKRPKGASFKYVLSNNQISLKLKPNEIESIVDDYAIAAKTAIEAGVDCLELHAAHGYLLSEFLSGFSNRRKDEYGGSLENRMRFPLEVVKRIRENFVGEYEDYPLLVKINLHEFNRNGIQFEEALEIAQMFEEAGVSGVCTSRGNQLGLNPFAIFPGKIPTPEIIENQKSIMLRTVGKPYMWYLKKAKQQEEFSPLYLLDKAEELQRNLNIPVVYVGGVTSMSHLDEIFDAGIEVLQIGRELIHDPKLIQKWTDGEKPKGSCSHCNKCLTDLFLEDGNVRCHKPLKEKKKKSK